MFSKYKKPTASGDAPAPGTASSSPVARTETAAPDAARKAMAKPMAPKRAAEAGPADRERRRKERLGEIKLELHKALLDNLNLAALDSATEQDLRAEIN